MKGLRSFGPIAAFVALFAIMNSSSTGWQFLPVLVIAGVLLAVAVWLGLRTRAFVASAWNADGTVVAVERGEGSKRRNRSVPHYYPTVRFSTITGEEVAFVSEVGSNPAAHKVGDRVTVLYDPHHPEDARIRSFLQLWFVPSLLAVVGAISAIAALVMAM